DTEMFVQRVRRSGRAKAVDADECACFTRKSFPSHGTACLNGNAHSIGTNSFNFVSIILLFKQLPAGNGDDAGANPISLEQSLRGKGEADLRAGGKKSDLRFEVGGRKFISATGREILRRVRLPHEV